VTSHSFVNSCLSLFLSVFTPILLVKSSSFSVHAQCANFSSSQGEGVKFLVQMFVFICVFFCDECGRALLCSRAFVECTQSVCIPDRECSASLGFDSNVRQCIYILA
jgi:hypothetical protein